LPRKALNVDPVSRNFEVCYKLPRQGHDGDPPDTLRLRFFLVALTDLVKAEVNNHHCKETFPQSTQITKPR